MIYSFGLSAPRSNASKLRPKRYFQHDELMNCKTSINLVGRFPGFILENSNSKILYPISNPHWSILPTSGQHVSPTSARDQYCLRLSVSGSSGTRRTERRRSSHSPRLLVRLHHGIQPGEMPDRPNWKASSSCPCESSGTPL